MMSKPSVKTPRVAIVCDWLTNVGGAEKVLLSIHQLYPSAPIYTSKYDPKGIDWFKNADVRTGWLQIFPTKLRRFLAPLRQIYFNHLDLSDYDLIISVTGAEAKSIKKGTAKHLCYCHVPTQYYWQMYDEYVKNPGFGILDPIVRFFFKLLVKPLRRADFKAAQKPDQFITISTYAAEQIQRYYKRESVIIPPPVAVENFSTVQRSKAPTAFINFSRQVTWKRIDLIVKSCLQTKQPLILIGDGPEHQNLVKLASNSPLITFLPPMDQAGLQKQLSTAKAFIFPSLEPFGIAPVEALAAGCPVIAYRLGGAADYIKHGQNGLHFDRQTANSLSQTLRAFDQSQFSTTKIKQSALFYSDQRFKDSILKLVAEIQNAD